MSRIFDERGEPTYQDYVEGMELKEGYSIAPHFPGYEFIGGKSTYRGEEVGEGGYVYAEPGIYTDVAVCDVASEHPTSIDQEDLFGPFTVNFRDLLKVRLAIKHKEYDILETLLGGRLVKYMGDETKLKTLDKVLKIPINSVYGLTAAHFDNPFRDPRNVDNIVAKRGALFMINLKHAVQEQGYQVVHIKTDSIKVPNADERIIQFIMDYGKEYGYSFEHECTYDRMCLVNDAVYIAKYDDKGVRNKGGIHANEWTATGTQFAVPYIFKTLFTKEPIEFSDLCETKSVQTAIYIDRNEDLEPGLHDYRFVGKVGLFSPIIPGMGGGNLVREVLDKEGHRTGFAAVVGSSGYRWLESEDIQSDWKKFVDMSYYDNLADKAREKIGQYGDFEQFIGA